MIPTSAIARPGWGPITSGADIVRELVRQSGLPKGTFDRRFRAATGYSPLAYIQALHIEEAKQLLETGAATIEAVAREVGYEDM
ncbi:MAG TPA: AraC family transcriptional regulator, partial [Hyphomicrobiaceae bacterium]|nr:AraC family transcriptional regulator [Hyphomicrobiaceae bacterium]